MSNAGDALPLSRRDGGKQSTGRREQDALQLPRAHLFKEIGTEHQRRAPCTAPTLILILDDSTSAVDTATDAQIRRALREDVQHLTKIIISQRLSSIMDADQIFMMSGGRIVDRGTHAELMERNAEYRQLYEMQEGGRKNA